jgi:hypothetical protein
MLLDHKVVRFEDRVPEDILVRLIVLVMLSFPSEILSINMRVYTERKFREVGVDG